MRKEVRDLEGIAGLAMAWGCFMGRLMEVRVPAGLVNQNEMLGLAPAMPTEVSGLGRSWEGVGLAASCLRNHLAKLSRRVSVHALDLNIEAPRKHLVSIFWASKAAGHQKLNLEGSDRSRMTTDISSQS